MVFASPNSNSLLMVARALSKKTSSLQHKKAFLLFCCSIAGDGLGSHLGLIFSFSMIPVLGEFFFLF